MKRTSRLGFGKKWSYLDDESTGKSAFCSTPHDRWGDGRCVGESFAEGDIAKRLESGMSISALAAGNVADDTARYEFGEETLYF